MTVVHLLKSGLHSLLAVTLLMTWGYGSEAHAGLPLEDEDDFSSPAHEANVGKIIFAPKEKHLSFKKEKPKKFKTNFKLTEPMYWRVYMEHSPLNMMRAQGIDCQKFRGEIVWAVTVDGKGFKAAEDDSPAGMIHVTKSDGKQWKRWRTWWMGEPLNGPTEAGTTGETEGFEGYVVPFLTPGKRTLKISAYGRCRANNVRTLGKKPLAEAEIQLTVTASGLKTYARKTAKKMPKPGMRNGRLEKDVAALAKKHLKGDKILKVVLKNKKWSVEVNRYTRLPVLRRMDALVATKRPSGLCEIFEVGVKQKTAGRKKWNKTLWAGVGVSSSPILCGNAK